MHAFMGCFSQKTQVFNCTIIFPAKVKIYRHVERQMSFNDSPNMVAFCVLCICHFILLFLLYLCRTRAFYPITRVNQNDRKKAKINTKALQNVDYGMVKVLFGSQTGTAEDFSQTFVKELTEMDYSAEVKDLEDYNFVIFLYKGIYTVHVADIFQQSKEKGF